jgi:hypothetical protein
VHVCVVSSTTTSNRDRQEFWRWQQEKFWNFKGLSYFWIWTLWWFIVIQGKEAIVVALWLCWIWATKWQCVEFINLN